MSMDLCPHKTNPKCCPTCYRLKPPEPVKKPEEAMRPGIPMGVVIPIGDATIRATQNAARARITGKAPVQGSNQKSLKEAHYSANQAPSPEAHSKDAVWQPPQHAELIDRLPVHPHLAESKTQIRG
jgi:hypothetical protein